MENVMHKSQIFVVDDNVELLEELEKLLQSGGYEVTAISEGDRLFQEAYKKKPDLVLLDLKMTPKTGFEIADEMKHSSILKDVPVIAMTGFFNEKQHFLMMKLCGIKAAIFKPFHPVNLIAKIEFALGHRPEEYDTDA
jgi:DNA-binding response OmpR family regulator